MFILTTLGSYPRPPWFREYLKKIEGLQKEGSGEISQEMYRKAVREVIKNQRKAGIKLFTDGQLIWQDFLAYLTIKLSGFKPNGLVRYFDNNLYYREPVVKTDLERKGKIVLDEFKTAKELEPEIKAVLSCFTLTKLSKNEFCRDEREFIFSLAKLMKEEIKDLIDIGARYIQFDEPCLLYANKEEIELVKTIFELMTKDMNAKFFLITYFGNAEAMFPEILDFKVDVLGLDMIEGYGRNLELIKEYGLDDKGLNLGIVDGRNTRIEKKEEINAKLEKILNVTSPKEIYLSPNTGLEFLPYSKAFEKLKVMKEVVR